MLSHLVPRRSPLQAIFVLAIALRLGLAAVNDQANDPHIEPIRVLAYEGRWPEPHQSRLVFHPRFYHLTVAAVLRLVGPPDGDLWADVPAEAEAYFFEVRLANLISCVAGIATLWIFLHWLQECPLTRRTQVLVFSLLALNTKLIAIHSQATNDAFVILFATLSLFWGFRFWQQPRPSSFCWSCLSAVLASVSKGNGLVVPLVYTAVLAAAICRPWPPFPRHKTLTWACLWCLVCVVGILWLGPYRANYRRTGTPWEAGFEPPPPPAFLEKTNPPGGAGVRSVAEALFTFRLASLLREPMISNDDEYPAHRTSLWSQLYGRLHFTHFDYWPPSWQTQHPALRQLGRGALLWGLFPTLLLLAGVAAAGVEACRWLVTRRPASFHGGDLLLAVTVYAFLAFSVAYALRCRAYSCLKPIFLFPGLLGYAWSTARFYDRLAARHDRPVWSFCRKLLDTCVVLLCATYVLEILILTGRLGWRYLRDHAW